MAFPVYRTDLADLSLKTELLHDLMFAMEYVDENTDVYHRVHSASYCLLDSCEQCTPLEHKQIYQCFMTSVFGPEYPQDMPESDHDFINLVSSHVNNLLDQVPKRSTGLPEGAVVMSVVKTFPNDNVLLNHIEDWMKYDLTSTIAVELEMMRDNLVYARGLENVSIVKQGLYELFHEILYGRHVSYYYYSTIHFNLVMCRLVDRLARKPFGKTASTCMAG